jgi:hypothetical protein
MVFVSVRPDAVKKVSLLALRALAQAWPSMTMVMPAQLNYHIALSAWFPHASVRMPFLCIEREPGREIAGAVSVRSARGAVFFNMDISPDAS